MDHAVFHHQFLDTQSGVQHSAGDGLQAAGSHGHICEDLVVLGVVHQGEDVVFLCLHDLAEQIPVSGQRQFQPLDPLESGSGQRIFLRRAPMRRSQCPEQWSGPAGSPSRRQHHLFYPYFLSEISKRERQPPLSFLFSSPFGQVPPRCRCRSPGCLPLHPL